MSDIEMKAKFKQWYLTKAPKQFKEMFAKTTEEEGGYARGMLSPICRNGSEWC